MQLSAVNNEEGSMTSFSKIYSKAAKVGIPDVFC